MSALARYYKTRGAEVSGYDRTPTFLTQELISEGIFVSYEDIIEYPQKKFDLVIYTPAIPDNNIQLNYYRENGYRVLKRAQVLGDLSQDHFTIAVSGSHGKTTITAMIAHILKTAEEPMCAFIGGVPKNYQTNYIEHAGGDKMVVEADEFDRSFLKLNPDIAVITSMDADHLDVYSTQDELVRTFGEFAGNLKTGGLLLRHESVDINGKSNVRHRVYGSSPEADYRPENITTDGLRHIFTLQTPGGAIEKIALSAPGKYNIENAIAAAAVCLEAGISGEMIRTAMGTYTGVRRRFDFRIISDDIIYMDDYAHHPEEIKACIRTLYSLFPGKKLTGIFQPHLYSRTRDLAAGFAEALDLLDEAILMDIYPAREKPIPGISSEIILEKMKTKEKELVKKEDLLNKIRVKDPELLVTMGAGDIDQFVEPIEDLFMIMRSR